ncbi:GerMN domain-containing protein [Curtobacterium flaccumfaciens pv. flaccumfaciens]
MPRSTPTGEYTQAVRPTSSTLTFQFVREDGEWRIAYAPDGIILSPVSFESVFQAHALYFYDPTYRFLVPDQRWFLARSSTSTRIASALLAGPADWLKGAVVSSFPEGTQLSLNAVTIDSGTALVDLSSDALRASTVDKVRMREQLSKSLASVATISSVSMTIEGATLSVPDSGGADAQQNPDVDPRPLVDEDGVVGYAASGTGKVAELGSGVGAAIAGLDPTSIALSASGTTAAVGNRDGVVVVRGKDRLRVDAREDLVAPAVDDLGFVWVGQQSDTRHITAYGLGGDPPPGAHHPAARRPRVVPGVPRLHQGPRTHRDRGRPRPLRDGDHPRFRPVTDLVRCPGPGAGRQRHRGRRHVGERHRRRLGRADADRSEHRPHHHRRQVEHPAEARRARHGDQRRQRRRAAAPDVERRRPAVHRGRLGLDGRHRRRARRPALTHRPPHPTRPGGPSTVRHAGPAPSSGHHHSGGMPP